MARRPMIRLVVAALSLACSTTASAALPRSAVDRPDEVSGKQIHVFYVLPSDGADAALDTNGTLANSVASFAQWFAGKAAPRALRLDTFGGELDITFLRLGPSRTDASMRAEDPFIRDELEEDLVAAGFNHADKLYAVYYDGTSDYACGGGAWPPTLPGKVAAMYLKGLPSAAVPCGTNGFAGAGGAPAYLEFAMLHEILHTLGGVASCAPNHHLSGHVDDDADDLLWAGSGSWIPSGWASVKLDAGGDDYFRHAGAGCLDLEDSFFLGAPAPGGGGSNGGGSGSGGGGSGGSGSGGGSSGGDTPTPPPAPPVLPGAPPAHVADTRPPGLAAALAPVTLGRALRAKSLAATVRSDEAAALRLRLVARIGRRTIVVGSATARVSAGRRGASVTIRIGKAALRALRRARSAALTLEVRGVDGAGNAATATARRTLAR